MGIGDWDWGLGLRLGIGNWNRGMRLGIGISFRLSFNTIKFIWFTVSLSIKNKN